jgi:hypothetical protein
VRGAWLAIALVAVGCLPEDGRPEPGELLVVAEASEATRDGVVDFDGATYVFDRAALTLGTYLIDSGECAGYAPIYYDWLVDFTQPGPHKIGLLHGLGECTAGYDTYPPDAVTVFGAGADAALAQTMGDANLYVEGRAERDGERIGFRFRVYWSQELTPCLSREGSTAPIVTTLRSGEKSELMLTIRFETVFEGFSFDQLKQSDLDGDGIVDELELNILGSGSEVLGDGLYAPPISRVVTARDGWVCPSTTY